MGNLTDEEARKLDENQNKAIDSLKYFNYAYTPAPIAPFPDSITDIKKYVNITPIGTYAPNDDGRNPIVDYMMKLPDKQSPQTCIVNAAMLKTRTLASTPFENQPIGGTQKNITKDVKSKQLIRDTVNVIKQVQKTESQTFYKNVSRTGTRRVSKPTKVYINGLHFRATKDNCGYMGDNPNYFNQIPSTYLDIDTTKAGIYTDDLYLPTNFSSLENATRTNATLTPNRDVYTIFNNVNRTDSKPERHYFAVEWTGFFKPNMTGEWLFTTNSDDVSFLWVESDNTNLNGVFTLENVSVDNRGLHGMQYRTSEDKKLFMTNGRFYRIKIQFSENGGGYDMIVTARCKNGGPTITDFTGFFYAEVIKNVDSDETYNYIETVPYKKDVQVTVNVPSTDIVYRDGGVTTQTISMGDMFNPTYNINDENAVYVSMVKDPTIGNGPNYDCYVSNQWDVTKLNTVFNQADDKTPIFNIIDIWQSNSQGNVNDDKGFCNINRTGSLLLDDRTVVQGLQDTTITNIMSGNVKDEIPYMYIGESNDGSIIIPSIILYQKSKGMKKKINIYTDSTYKEIIQMCKDGIIKQFQNNLWISQESNILAYNENNEDNKPEMGIIYKITNKKALISNNKMFRLILKNGKLTLQMCINPTKTNEDHDNIKYTEKLMAFAGNPSSKQNLTPNTMAILKIDTDHRINSVNLIDKLENKSYYVPDSISKKDNKPYTVYNNKYSTYNDMYPSKSRINDGYVVKNADACKNDCDKSADCRAYYSYKKGKTPMCTLVGGKKGSDPTNVSNFPDTTDPQLFNPASSDPDVISSSLSIKNKTINSDYNKSNNIYNIQNITYTGGNTTTEKNRKFYPDQSYDNKNMNCTDNADGTFNCDPTFEDLKELVRIRTDDKRKKLSEPTNINQINITKYNKYMNDNKIVDIKNYEENFTNYREAYTPLTIKTGSTDNVSSMCNNPSNNAYGLCDIANNLKKINQLQDNINTNSSLLTENKNTIKSKVSNIDTNFQTLSNNSSNNIYKYDFNGYDDNPDTSMLGAIERDTNVLLLYENNMYIIGTIITTSLAILGIILARS